MKGNGSDRMSWKLGTKPYRCRISVSAQQPLFKVRSLEERFVRIPRLGDKGHLDVYLNDRHFVGFWNRERTHHCGCE